jgi:hypothetical protein
VRWPWQPREYVAVLAALHETEKALARREVEARRQRAAQEKAQEVQAEVGRELDTRRKGRT